MTATQLFETYDDFTDELQLVFGIVMDKNEPEDLDAAVAAIIETDELGLCREYFVDVKNNTEEEWEAILVEMCEEHFA